MTISLIHRMMFFFFKHKTAYDLRISDWSSDVCSSDLVKLRAQAALGMSDTSGNMPFLSRLAAARCAFRWVASIINWSGLPALAASAAKILLNTPSRLQRMKRVYKIGRALV